MAKLEVVIIHYPYSHQIFGDVLCSNLYSYYITFKLRYIWQDWLHEYCFLVSQNILGKLHDFKIRSLIIFIFSYSLKVVRTISTYFILFSVIKPSQFLVLCYGLHIVFEKWQIQYYIIIVPLKSWVTTCTYCSVW